MNIIAKNTLAKGLGEVRDSLFLCSYSIYVRSVAVLCVNGKVYWHERKRFPIVLAVLFIIGKAEGVPG